MTKLLKLALIPLLASLISHCERHQETVQKGDIIQAPIVEKFTQGQNHPSKGLKKRYYLKLFIEPAQVNTKVIVDRGTYNQVNIGDKLYGYFYEGNFVLARGGLRAE